VERGLRSNWSPVDQDQASAYDPALLRCQIIKRTEQGIKQAEERLKGAEAEVEDVFKALSQSCNSWCNPDSGEAVAISSAQINPTLLLACRPVAEGTVGMVTQLRPAVGGMSPSCGGDSNCPCKTHCGGVVVDAGTPLRVSTPVQGRAASRLQTAKKDLALWKHTLALC